MRRRAFLVTGVGAATAAGGAGLWLVFRRGVDTSALGVVTCEGGRTLAVNLDDLLTRPESVRRAGQAILHAARIWPTRSEIAERLFSGDRWVTACRDGARATLLDAIRSDFREDRTVAVRGWVLSRTEADLYALAELVLSSS